AEELMQAIGWGHEARSRASTDANIDSSRSHAILQVRPTQYSPGSSHTISSRFNVGKLSFIDLAGSERASDT
ncbi:kinesin motor domain-containing protein, partial [Baffinella frigidus]